MHIGHLEFVEPAAVCEVHAGTFYWKNPQGQDCDADFYVNTCADEENKSKRVDDLNQQLTDEWYNLIRESNTNIRYVEIVPSPIF